MTRAMTRWIAEKEAEMARKCAVLARCQEIKAQNAVLRYMLDHPTTDDITVAAAILDKLDANSAKMEAMLATF